jgi:predicted Zn-dependent protease
VSESTLISLEEGIELYKKGESIDRLLIIFQDLCQREPKNPTALSCMAWLYLLSDKPKSALKSAQKSIKLDSRSPQARINLALAMMDSGESGIRPHIESAAQIMALNQEIRSDIEENILDGLARKPDWKSLQRVKTWLLTDEG